MHIFYPGAPERLEGIRTSAEECKEMLNFSLEACQTKLALLSQRLQTLKEEFREHRMLSDPHQAIWDRIQREKDRLAMRLSDARRTGNWDLIKAEFGSAWNSFVADLELLELQLLDADDIKERKA